MDVSACLRDGALRELFIDQLGWDHAQGTISLEVNGEHFILDQIAQKRGFLVARLITDRINVQTKHFVRAIQAKLSRLAHEHLLVATDEQSRVHVWAWAYREDGRLRHRFHPFFTSCIPPRMIARVERLAVSLNDEERITLPDVVGRTRAALDAVPDQHVFFRRPAFARKSHELAIRMRAGGTAEFHEFVVFHLPLAGWYAKRFRNSVYDEEDMRQEAAIGLILAANHFDPERGVAFSTYAVMAMSRACRRFFPRAMPLGPVPDYIYWPFRRIMRRWEQEIAAHGPEAGLVARDEAVAEEGLDDSAVVDLCRMAHAVSLRSHDGRDWEHCVGEVDYTEDLPSVGRTVNPLSTLALRELCDCLHRGLDRLLRPDSRIIRMRFGIACQGMTFDQLGAEFRLTREGARQRLNRAIDALRGWLLRQYFPELIEQDNHIPASAGAAPVEP